MMAGHDEVLVPSSQGHRRVSEPPRKKRRIEQFLDDSEDESISDGSQASVDLPQSEDQGYIEVDDDILGNYRSKYEAVMHEPAYVESQQNTFVTQVDQPWSSPSRIRGPRWRKKTPTPTCSAEDGSLSWERSAVAPADREAAEPFILDEFNDEDLQAFMAVGDLEQSHEDASSLRFDSQATSRSQAKGMRQTTLFGMSTTQQSRKAQPTQSRVHNWPLVRRNESPTHHKINEDAMQTWIFPLNIGTIRDYQYNIVYKALFNNILVALPTGLGKTFIAAAVMMNWYNWTKDAQLVFMAPTKPLVAQQIEACFHIAGIPRSQTTLMTGEIPSHVRAEEWQTKRVFFMTPQTFSNDLRTGIADPKRIVLVVVDEAHKATGNYAYVDVVRFLRRFNESFRVLALTATPGATVEAVQKVIDGLGIARVEIRTEESLDIRAFVHQRNTELELFDYSDEINMCMDLFSKAIKPVMDKLSSQNAYWGKDPTAITLYGLMMARKQWSASDAGRKANWGIKGMVNNCFATLQSLAHNLELLKFHGIGPFFSKMKSFQEEHSSGGGKYPKMIIESEHFINLMSRVRAWIQDEDFVGHPKLAYLKSVALNHFMDAGNGTGRAAGRAPSDTRIMIFAHYRDSAEEICRVLNRHQPMIRAHVFVGQASTKASEGMDQKTQTDIIQKFKGGMYNTLVATSIGEEGLDIGEVDLIVCYDCSKSPIRMLQRMGRTGRKRAGNIVMLLMRGKEERDYYGAKDNYQRIQDIIESGRQFEFHEDSSPRIVPKGIAPVVSRKIVEIPIENTQPDAIKVEPKRSRTKPKKKPPKKFHMPDGVETRFQFLGSKRQQKMVSEGKVKKSKFLDDREAILPADQAVLLSGEQELELEEKFASIAGDEPQYIQLVDPARRPENLRKVGKTYKTSHSITTKVLIQGLGVARTSAHYLSRPGKLTGERSVLCTDVEVNEQDPFDIEQMFGKHEEPFYIARTQRPPETSQPDGFDELEKLFDDGPVNMGEKSKSRCRRRKNVISDEGDEG